ncbi:MAG: carbon starvation CstA 5TM domain-containing protein, partial [Planctomycetota bacterium]
FLLYLMMLFGIGGLLYASISGAAPTTIEMHAFGAFVQPSGPMFPILFVTIACGAISGFHSLVASGTTSKQLDKESDAKVVGYGGMLIEVCLAALSLAVVASMSPDVFARHSAGGVINVFQQGLGTFIATLGIPMSFATTFVGLSISAFALTSLDTCTRLARFIWQEFFEVRRHTHAGAADDRVEMAEPKNTLLGHSMAGRITGTLVPVVCGGALTLSGQWKVIWPLFGAANQMLGALALMAAAVWLSRKGMKTMYVIVPMVLMFAITLTALGVLFVSNLRGALAAADDAAMKALPGQYLLCGLSLVLFALSVVLLVRAVMALRGGRETPAPAASVVAPT